MPAQGPDLGNEEALRAWLEKQPPEVAVAIAVRAAMRVLPGLDNVIDGSPSEDTWLRIVLDVFYLVHLSWVAVRYPDRQMQIEPNRPLELFDEQPKHIRDAVNSSAFLRSVLITYLGKDDGVDRLNDVMITVTSADYSAEQRSAPGTIYAAASADAELIEDGRNASEVAGAPLWIDENPLSGGWPALKDRLLSQKQDWQVWTDWYDARLRGESAIEEIEIARAAIDEKIWEQGPAAVNSSINDLEARFSSGSVEIGKPPKPDPDEAGAKDGSVDGPGAAEPDQAAPEPAVKPEPAPSESTPTTPSFEGYADLTFLDDRPDTENDVLGRSNLAFMLAGKLNQVWDALNPEPKPPVAEGENAYDSSTWAPKAHFEREPELADGAFVVHVDAPWGGGKTTFANYLARLLNPYVHPGPLPDWDAMRELAGEDFSPPHFRRPWHIVQFNAWQHQHVSPPWWAFYQAIRKQGFHGIRADTNRIAGGALEPPPGSFSPGPLRQLDWLALWLRELGWRLFNPKNQVLLVIIATALGAALLLDYLGLLAIEKAKLTWDLKGVSSALATALTVLAGGGAFIWTIVSTATESLLPGTPSAAKNYSLGAGDPLDRFRRYFAATMKRLRRPVLVVIDDLDRCKPEFVVELVRGMQTILRSPRVVFLILGDRDWIEHAFAEQHKAMEGIDVGPEHSFGGRFVEKAIQMSLVLPEVDEERREDYVKALLNVYTSEETPAPDEKPKLESIVADIEQIANAPTIEARDTQVDQLRQRVQSDVSNDEVKKAVTRQINRTAALKNATDARLHAATQHRIVPLAPVLPANPRQIKRIINAIALYQEIGRIEADIQPQGDPRWQQLAQWVVLMTEYPQTWYTLNQYSGLADRFHRPRAKTDGDLPETAQAKAWLKAMKGTEAVSRLMAYGGWSSDGNETRIDGAAIDLFGTLIPAASGTMLPMPPSAKTE